MRASLPAYGLWIDGSFMPASGRMGAGFVLIGATLRQEISAPLLLRPADSGRAEILAAALGLEAVPSGESVSVTSDHQALLSVLGEIAPCFAPDLCLVPSERKLRRIKRLMRGAKCEDWQRLLAAASKVRIAGLFRRDDRSDPLLKLAHDLARIGASSPFVTPKLDAGLADLPIGDLLAGLTPREAC